GAQAALVERRADGSWLVDGIVDIRRLSSLIETNLVDRHNRYATLAGYVLSQLGHLPAPGERVVDRGLAFEIVETDGRNIGKV
ncbi:transporter associated domain-containing protein, partial [Acinetobacter baumannii]